MYGIFTNICPKNHPNVGKYTIHGAYGYGIFHNIFRGHGMVPVQNRRSVSMTARRCVSRRQRAVSGSSPVNPAGP